MQHQQVLANKDASPFLRCFVAVVVVVVVVIVVIVVAVAVVWVHVNIVYHSCSFSIGTNRQNIGFWRIKRMRFRRTDRRTDGPSDGRTDQWTDGQTLIKRS